MTKHQLRPMTEADLEQVLQWRNHPEVRRCMYTTHEIHLDEHREWFESASANPSIDLLIYEKDDIPQGFVNITRTRCAQVADWGFYLAQNSLRGRGRELGKLAIKYAFAQLGLHKICGQALGFNERSIAFHKTLGFAEEGRLREQHFDGSQFHDVVCFGLLNRDWQLQAED